MLDVCHTPDERLAEFPPDIYTFFLFLKYKDDPEKLKASLQDTSPVRGVTCEAVADCVGERRLRQFIPKKKGDKVHMCKAIDMLIADGEKRGMERERKNTERERKNTERERKNAERERKNAERERIRAEKAEARVRELEERLKAL